MSTKYGSFRFFWSVLLPVLLAAIILVFVGVTTANSNSSSASAKKENAPTPQRTAGAPIKLKSLPSTGGTPAPVSPMSDVSLQLDDGTREHKTVYPDFSTEYASIWLNRFTPGGTAFPFTVNTISIMWPDEPIVGKHAKLLVYLDVDGDNNPANATLVGQQIVTIGVSNAFETYNVNIPVAGPSGDVYVGYEDFWAEGGYSPSILHASVDSSSQQQRSWLIADDPPQVPDINNLGNNPYIDTLEGYGLYGNFMIRATGQPGACGNGNYYIIQTLPVTIVPGTTDIGNHCDDCLTTITLPFSFHLYDRTFTAASVSSNGNIQFVSSNDTDYNNVCLPASSLDYAILPHWDDLNTSPAGMGIFTSVSGNSPNRIFNIEWRAAYYSGGGSANFELRLYENASDQRFDVVYGNVTQNGTSATAGVQKATGSLHYTFECNGNLPISQGLQTSYRLSSTCASPTATPAPPSCNLQPGQITSNLEQRTLLRHATLGNNQGQGDPNDETLAGWILNAFAPGGQSKVRDAIFLFQECYGGGMLDALQDKLNGSNGIRWVGGSAVKWNEESWFHAGPDSYLGGYWTSALLPEIVKNQTVLSAVATAAANDPRADETGQWISAHSGETATLPDTCATKHYAILWAGYIKRGEITFFHTIEMMRQALESKWPANKREIITLYGDGQYDNDGNPLPAGWDARPATSAELQAAINEVGSQITSTDQFLFYVSDHGGFTLGWPHFATEVRSNGTQTDPIEFTLSQNDLDALTGERANGEALHIEYSGSLDNSTSVAVFLNGVVLGYLQRGYASMDFNIPENVLEQSNQLLLQSINSSPIEITTGEFRSGPIGGILEQALAGTASPTPTATPCPIRFSDVPSESTFYNYILTLTCRGIVSGYNDGTFHPEANVTRGQVAKFVVNSAILNDPVPVTQQTFEDVGNGSTFWLYIERLAGRGYINGYPCGSQPAGPCVAPANRPYFLPNSAVSRGQLSKIVANAAGFDEVISGQLYEDVGSTSPFYSFVSRLALHGAISGYNCGAAPGGPCISPGNLPYFAPGNAVTRGQTAKIVANTFFAHTITP